MTKEVNGKCLPEANVLTSSDDYMFSDGYNVMTSDLHDTRSRIAYRP